jgi:hypothetical protein
MAVSAFVVFGRKSEGVRFGHGAGGADDFPEGPFEASPWFLPRGLDRNEMRGKPGAAGFSECSEHIGGAGAKAAAKMGPRTAGRRKAPWYVTFHFAVLQSRENKAEHNTQEQERQEYPNPG